MSEGERHDLERRIFQLTRKRNDIEPLVLNTDGPQAEILLEFISELEDEERFLEQLLVTFPRNQ